MKKIALVTGASKGIGRALVEELVEKGWIVIGIARSNALLEELTEIHAEKFIGYVCDVSDRERVKEVSKQLQDQGLFPTQFFLNAGLAGETVIEIESQISMEKHRKVFEVNYFGVLYWVDQWAEICKQHEGARFLVTSSVNAVFVPPIGSAYGASKSAIAKAFEGLSLKYYGSNVSFASMYAGPVKTEGLYGKVPFAWTSKRIAKYMVTSSNSKRTRFTNSVFYWLLSKVLRKLPAKLTLKILGS